MYTVGFMSIKTPRSRFSFTKTPQLNVLKHV